MRKLFNIKTGLCILLLVAKMSGLYGQGVFDQGERQPFNQPVAAASPMLQRAPGLPGIPPPTEADKVGGVPVGDHIWMLSLLAVGYGIYRRKNTQL